MESQLRLTIDHDPDGTSELFAEVRASDFAGRSSAWVNAEELAELGEKLGLSFPLAEPLEIAGGFWSGDEPATLTQEHLALRFYPVGHTGTVGCRVRLAQAVHPNGRLEAQCSVSVEMLTSYAELQRFGPALRRLAEGSVSEVLLHGAAA